MIIEEIQEKELWESYLLSSSDVPPFFQSWNWSLVQERLGNKVFRLGMFEEKNLVGVCLAVLIAARRGKYLHLRHGPVFTDFTKNFDEFLPFVTRFIHTHRVSFLRMSPLLPQERFDMSFLRSRGFRNAPIHNMDAENGWVLDIQKTDEELLAGMRKTTRYLVRKAEKSDLTIRKTTDPKDFKKFLDLYEITSKRHKFVPHRGMEEELEIFGKDNQSALFLVEYKRNVIAGALIIFYGKQAIYHHAASDDTYRDIPAAYGLQWAIIKEARSMGKTVYNFWGVVPPEKPKHPWQGLTLFKTGFGGRRVNYIHAQDLPLLLTYWKTHVIENLWRIRRGY